MKATQTHTTRRILASLAALFGFLVLLAPPAHADWSEARTATDCNGFDDGHECLAVTYLRDSDNVGFKLLKVNIYGCPTWPTSPCTNVNGTFLKCWNEDGVIKWSQPADQINFGRDESKIWYPQDVWPSARELNCSYRGEFHHIFNGWQSFPPLWVNRT